MSRIVSKLYRGQGAAAIAVAADDQPIAVVLDLMQPAVTGRQIGFGRRRKSPRNLDRTSYFPAQN